MTTKMRCDRIRWRRLGVGHYVSTNGTWALRRWRKREWWVFRDRALWGRWKRNCGWRRYFPFRTKREAMAAIEGHTPSCSLTA
jgi:hypothetical protein